MKAVCFSKFGPTVDSALELSTNIPKPFISSPSEILIRVHVAALNPHDKWRVQGRAAIMKPEDYDQSILGQDVAGIVQEVGTDVQKFKVGDEIYAYLYTPKYGCLAEYVVGDANFFGFKPSNVSFSEAAAVPVAGLTALQALRHGGVAKGSKVFIASGTGGVGSLAIQIAKTMLDASYVCTTASAGAGAELCQKLGADRVIDYKSEDFSKVLEGEDFNMAFDTCDEGSRMGGLLKQGGKIISISGMPSIGAIADKVGPPRWIIQIIWFLMRNRAAERAAASKGGTWECTFSRSPLVKIWMI